MITSTVISILAVVGLFILYLGILNLIFTRRNNKRERVQQRVQRLRQALEKADEVEIERKRDLSTVPWLNTMLSRQAWTKHWDTILEQANVNTNLGTLVSIACIGGLVGYFIGRMVTNNMLIQPVPGILFGYLPFYWVKSKRAKRMETFKRQLPDALDLITRALKAGHAFAQGMRMVADEFTDPIGPEFAKTLDEINFGISPEIALQNLINRVDCPDLKFFVVSVNIQRETGGNLSEIVGNISRLVRERFKFQGRVKILSAEGRLTAYVLLALPFGVGLVINFLNPEYMSLLYTTPEGNMMLTGALVQMAIGALVLKHMITIDV